MMVVELCYNGLSEVEALLSWKLGVLCALTNGFSSSLSAVCVFSYCYLLIFFFNSFFYAYKLEIRSCSFFCAYDLLNLS